MPLLSNFVLDSLEADTLDSVTDRGATTTNAITVGNLTSTGIDDNASSNAITIDSSENVGIGNTSPSTVLDIEGVWVNNQGLLALNATSGVYSGLTMQHSGTAKGYLYYDNASQFLDLYSTNDLRLISGGSERARITSAGNVGIGTTSPTSKLQVEGTVAVSPSGTAGDFLTIASGNYQTTIGGWSNGTDSDIDGLLSGSTFGSIMRVAPNGHFVVALQENDNADTFSVVSGGGNYQTDTTYDTLALTVDSRGHTSIAGNLTVGANGTHTGSEGGEIGLRSNDGSTNAFVLDVAGSYNRLFTTTANQYFQIGQLGGTGGLIAFYTAASERMRISSAGYVGIGTSSPGFKLDIKNGGGVGLWVEGHSTGYTQGAIVSSSGTTDSPNNRGQGLFMFNHGTDTTWYIGGLYGSGNPDRFDICRQSSTSFQQSTAQGTYSLATFSNSGNLSIDGTLTQNSDVSIKDNVQNLPNQLDNINALRPVEYDRNDKLKAGDHEIGLIAQEVESLLPDLVGERNGLKTLDYARLSVILLKGLQELSAKVAALEAN